MADYHLDLHSMHTNGTPFSFEDYEEQKEFAKIQGLEYIFTGWPSIYKNSKTTKDYSTQAYGHRVHTVSTTVECGSHIDKKSIDIAEKCILRSLNYLDIIDYKEDKTNIKQKNIIMKKVIFKEKDGVLTENKNNLDPIRKGEILVQYSDGEKLLADDNYLIIFPNYNANIGEEWFYLGTN